MTCKSIADDSHCSSVFPETHVTTLHIYVWDINTCTSLRFVSCKVSAKYLQKCLHLLHSLINMTFEARLILRLIRVVKEVKVQRFLAPKLQHAAWPWVYNDVFQASWQAFPLIQCVAVKQSYVESDLCSLPSLIQLLALCKTIIFTITASFLGLTVIGL